MNQWIVGFGKAGNGMHVSCVILRDTNTNKHVKRTYISFIGRASQDVGTVLAIYQSVLEQVKIDFPHKKYVINKSDNAGYYHNEVLLTWKSYWPLKIGLKFLETMFNERQSGKDQCNRDSATAKRQMHYYTLKEATILKMHQT